jgi:SAM-dependent methyltransferase
MGVPYYRRVSARRRRSTSGRLASLGQDFDRGHREYVERMPESGRLWLRTKPFSAPPNYELQECLHTFAHVVAHLGLGLRAKILDVGCGPGWMSELLARCGYAVTGIDISEDMVEIARLRVDRIPDPAGEGLPPLAEFHALQVKDMPWSDRFDAAVLFDTMHHFDDELETLRVICRSLVPGGRIFIREGARPAPGSASEEVLIEEMRRHGTLESPFEPGYLLDVVRRAGFEEARLLLQVDELVDVGDARQPIRALRRFVRYRTGRGEMNTLVARKPLETGLASTEENFAGEIVAPAGWQESSTPNERVLWLYVTNTGKAFWPAAAGLPFPKGAVTVGVYAFDPDGARIEIARTPLPQGVAPGESAQVVVRAPLDVGSGLATHVDLVREGYTWFGDLGATPLVLPAGG